MSLVGEDPDGMKGVDPKLMSNFSKTLRGMTQPYRDKLDYMHAAWCVASVPTMAWAKKVYPESEDALSDLWDAV